MTDIITILKLHGKIPQGEYSMTKKEQDTLVIKYMGGKERPFPINGYTEILWQECEIEKVNGNPVENQPYIREDWNQLIPVAQKAVKELQDIQKEAGMVSHDVILGETEGLIGNIEQSLVSMEISKLWTSVIQAIKYINEHEKE